METLRTGDLAYFDSFWGLIPCKVLRIEGLSGVANSAQTVTCQITSSNRQSMYAAYKRGEIMVTSALHVVPRKAVRGLKGFSPKIRTSNVEV